MLSRISSPLDVENISVAYNGTPVLQEITFQVQHGRALRGWPEAPGNPPCLNLVGLLPLRAEKSSSITCRSGITDCVLISPARGIGIRHRRDVF